MTESKISLATDRAPAGQPSATPAASPPGGERLDRQTRLTLAVLVIGGLAAVLDTTIVTIALHDLVIDLHSTVVTMQWVTTAYLLALTAVIPVVGWAEARLGGKRLWITALATFLVGSTLCALAWNPLSLIVFRVLQGCGAGVLMTLMMTLAMRAAHGRATARITASISLPIALGPIVGPVLGGVLLHWADWRSIFLINVPLCLIGIAAAWRVLPADGPGAGSRVPHLDVVGLGLLAPGLAVTIYGLSRCGDAHVVGGAAGTAGLLAVGLLLIVAFVTWALRRGGRALIDVRLFTRRSVGSASLMMFLVGITLYGSMFLLPLYWQVARGRSALGAAMLLIPMGIGSLLTRFFIAHLVERFGAPVVCFVAFLVTALGVIPFAFADARTNVIWLSAILFVRGLGLGALMVPIIASAYVGLEPGEVAHASMQTRSLQQLGGAVGVAIGAVLLQALSGRGVIGAFQGAFWVFAGLALLASFASFAMPKRA
ncbi:MDR family MFS transporter [Flexivirga caeni]|uniref:DHA2 family efflux MFS transporter permease subunit n=1 Tax=Flexivirga caeni TaxID=2294115 RepID=A0A3M9MGD9_9MICO|nr:MDR family MFS transporter [Flexivirga caeni]RNI24227.1 DHA2 family efflux MFS transporter permease subunit [Flexivirga caeni]